jgi:CHAD domain-containing protein
MSTHREREDKYDVPPDLRVTDALTPLVGGGVRVVRREHDLESVYFDTAERDLLRHRLTLRRRRGGSDSGWHLKVPSGRARTEIRIRDAGGDEVPPRLAELLTGVTRGRELHEVARLHTRRSTHRLTDKGDRVLVDVDDDTVRAASGDRVNEWREVEIEVGDHGDERLLATIGRHLRRAGATPSAYPSKLARALAAGETPSVEPSPLADYLRPQYDRLVAGDVALRRGVGNVHKTRVAIRRVRSTLRTFRPLLGAGAAQHLDDELRWYAGLLGEVRDRQVLRKYLDDVVDALPVEMRLGPVRARIDQQLTGEAACAQADVGAALRSERYFALLNDLERFVRDVPLRGRTSSEKLRKRARRAARKTVHRLDRALRAGDGEAAHLALHSTRKAAKRARYAAELVRPVAAKPARKQATRFERLQDILGEHHDSVVTAHFVRELGIKAGSTAGENGFSYGLLLCREQQRSARTRELARRWPRGD